MLVFKLLLLLCLQSMSIVQGHRILGLFVHPGKSHVDFFVKILHDLAAKGHDVTLLSYFSYPQGNNSNYTEIMIDNVPKEFYEMKVELHIPNPSRSIYSQIEEAFELIYWADPICEHALNSPSIDRILKQHKEHPFDLVIVELFNTECMLGVVHQMNIPFVSMSSCALLPWHYDVLGLPDTPSYLPSFIAGTPTKMGFVERATNWISVKVSKLLYRLRRRIDNKVLEKRFGFIPDVDELKKRNSLMLVNQHYSINGAKPLTPQVIEIGGLHIGESKPLPNDLQHAMDNAQNGVIVVSWGSLIRASTVDREKLDGILKAFKKLKELIVWKWEESDIPNKPSNVFIQKWLSQKDVLCHPKVKLFWAHGGNLGSLEAVHCGVPVLVTPIYGDQFLNGNAFVDRGMGLVLPFAAISEDSVTRSFQTLLQPGYKDNARKISYSFRNRPMTPIDTASWWVEHVIATGGNDLSRSYSTELSWFVYHSVDVLVFLGLSVSLLVFIAYLVIRVWRIYTKRDKTENTLKKKL